MPLVLSSSWCLVQSEAHGHYLAETLLLFIQSCPAVCNPLDCSTPGFRLSPSPRACSNSYPSSWWCHPTISSSRPLCLLPSIFPSIRVYSNESALRTRWSKYWCVSISPSDEYSGLISFRMDWLDLLAVQGTLKSLLQHHSSKASIIRRDTRDKISEVPAVSINAVYFQ